MSLVFCLNLHAKLEYFNKLKFENKNYELKINMS